MDIRGLGAHQKVSPGGRFHHAQGNTRTDGGNLSKISDVDPFMIELTLRHAAESIVTVPPDKRNFGSSSRRSHGTIGASAAAKDLQGAAHHAFSFHRQCFTSDHQISVIPSDHNYLRLG